MPVAVPIVAGTAIRGVAATLMMRRVLARHPNAFLITLANFGVTLPLHASQKHIAHDIQRGLERQGRPADSPVVLVGHSQGALASIRYALDHPDQVLHVISVGPPWNGSHSALRVSRLLGWAPRDITPALTDMAEGSEFLSQLHEDVPAIADRLTNIYSTHELFIRPYTDAHIDVPDVTNILISTEAEYRRHLMAYPELAIDGHIEGRITHLGEMSAPEVRAVIWAKVEEIADDLRRDDNERLA
ncbi:MAG TPA: alpha/beta hydrolase [Actinomycetota bacterium]|nr:alpha/beta hydrolase [Actinomycetota bacterium]